MNRRTRALRTARAALAITVLASSFAMGPLQTSGAVSPFGDVAGHPFAADIEWLRRSGITGGCAPNRFCPDEPVTREQMASFLVRARGLPATATDHLVDDEASAHETDINRLASAGVTTGCAAGRFCPSGQVTRQEMASFLVRAFGLPATTEDYFWDDDGSAHRADIDRLAASGITGGCGPGRFCPGQVVTRGQMAAFLRRALESPLAPPPVAGCSLFPATNVWNKPIDALPVASGSATLISTIGANSPLHPDFGSYLGYGIPYNVVGGSTPRSSVSFDYASESDPGPYPVPANPQIEAGSDRHLLMWDRSGCVLYELFAAQWTGSAWHAGSGAINHAIRFTAPDTRTAHIYPARHDAGDGPSLSLPPMGLRVRLKAGFDVSNFSPRMQVILTAMKRYGMILADNGSPWFFSGTSDLRWDDDELNELKTLRGADFEVVDTAGLVNG